MPGNEVKNWKVYHECMKDKSGSDKDKEYCARVANAVAAGTIKHSDAQTLADLIRYGAEQAVKGA